MCDGDLRTLVTAVARRGVGARDDSATQEELGAELVELRHLINLLEMEFARVAAAFERTGRDEQEWGGLESPTLWLRRECHMNTQRAFDALRIGAQAGGLPESVAAVERGEIGVEHLGLMSEVAECVQDGPEEMRPFDERALLLRAKKETVTRFRRMVAHVRHAVDMSGFLAGHIMDAERNRLSVITGGWGGVMLKGVFDPVSGATIRTALEPLARRTGADDERELGRRLADALVELCGERLDSGAIPQRGSRRPHLQVTASMETLMGIPGAPAGELEYAGPVPAATVQRLACDAAVSRIAVDAEGRALDVGRARRMPAAATRKALDLRDRGCVWPGCERPVSWTAAHHVHHWAHGGATALENLVLLCRSHHWRVHEGGWQLVRSRDGEVVVIPPAPEGLWWPRAPDQEAA